MKNGRFQGGNCSFWHEKWMKLTEVGWRGVEYIPSQEVDIGQEWLLPDAGSRYFLRRDLTPQIISQTLIYIIIYICTFCTNESMNYLHVVSWSLRHNQPHYHFTNFKPWQFSFRASHGNSMQVMIRGNSTRRLQFISAEYYHNGLRIPWNDTILIAYVRKMSGHKHQNTHRIHVWYIW